MPNLDLAVWQADHPRAAELLKRNGWGHTPEAAEDGSTAYTRGSVRLELAFLARDEDGEPYTPLRDGRAGWAPNAFENDVDKERLALEVTAKELVRGRAGQPRVRASTRGTRREDSRTRQRRLRPTGARHRVARPASARRARRAVGRAGLRARPTSGRSCRQGKLSRALSEAAATEGVDVIGREWEATRQQELLALRHRREQLLASTKDSERLRRDAAARPNGAVSSSTRCATAKPGVSTGDHARTIRAVHRALHDQAARTSS
jgi:hypothetical protein